MILGFLGGTAKGTRTPDLLIRSAIQSVFHRILLFQNGT